MYRIRRGATAVAYLCGVAFTAVSFSSASCASEPASAQPSLLAAQLLTPLDSAHLKPGAPVAARVLADWRYQDCRLEPGSMVKGEVTALTRRSKTEKAAIQISFSYAACRDRATSYGFTLIALIAPLPDVAPGMAEDPPLADAPGVATGTQPSANGGAFRSITAAAATSARMSGMSYGPLPSHIVMGQVVDVPQIEISVGTGIHGATVVTATRKDAHLERNTLLVLLPSSFLEARSAPAKAPGTTARLLATATHPSSPGAPAPAEHIAPEPDESEICSADCSVIAPLTSPGQGDTAASASLSLASLGYAPRERVSASALDHDTTLTYLDAHHLLCTFDPHHLRARSADGTEPLRHIRAVLIDPSTRAVERVVEWRVRGEDKYLWHVAQGQVLVHIDHELRLFNADLQALRSIPVEGAVPWVVSDPSGSHTAVAVERRRYTLSEYQFLNAAGQLPEDDMEVRVYDRAWNLTSVSIRSSASFPPALSDSGELRLSQTARNRWKITEYSWDRTAHILATVRSACRPRLSAPEHGLTFVIGCSTTTGNLWYRVLRPDGHSLLKAESTSDEVAQSATAGAPSTFAIRVVKAVHPLGFNAAFNRADLLREQIGVYRSSDGARLASVVTSDFNLADDAYAVSPDGKQLGVVGRSAILLFPLNH